MARALLAAGGEVRALVRAGTDDRALAGLPIERRAGDVRDAASVAIAMQGCDQVYHVAALYTYWCRRPADIYDTNVSGTRNVMRAALRAGVERVVYTSSVAVLGLHADGTPADEETPATLDDMVAIQAPSSWRGVVRE